MALAKDHLSEIGSIDTKKGIDALTIFTFLWSNICVLQCVKHYHSVKEHIFSSVLSIDVFLFFLLVVSVVCAMVQPNRSSSLLFLCSSHIISLLHHGSQSNHVVMALITASAVLLDYSTDRAVWQQRLSGTIYLILVILYLVSWTHKLNENWFDSTISCASLFASGFLSIWISLPTELNSTFAHHIAETVIRTAPTMAAIVEFTLPTLLILWRSTTFTTSRTIFRVLIVVAASFHLMICLPLPPMSVYPFSMVMVPMYALILPDESIRLISRVTENLWLIGGTVGVSAVIMQFGLKIVLNGEEMPLEYPAYGLWTTAVVWNVLVWAVILYAALSIKMPSATFKFPTFIYRPRGVLLAMFLGFIGLCPYLGIRNYPALAMFSNLRTEGTSPNHLYLPRMGVLNYQRDTVHVHSTSLKSLQNYQVNLAIYFSEHTKKFNTAFGVTNQFWISPPSWSPPDNRPAPFVPYSIPVLEFRKHISTQTAKAFYVNFTMNADPISLSRMFDSDDPNTYAEYGHLMEPVSWIQRILFRFRSFDSDFSPCRH